MFKIPLVLGKNKLHGNVPGKSTNGGSDVHRGPLDLKEPAAQLIREPLDHILPTGDASLGKEWAQGSTAAPVHVVVYSADGSLGRSEGVVGPVVLIPPAILPVELLVVGRVVDVQLVGADPHYGPVLPVQLGDLERVLAVEYHVEISLVIARSRGQLWSGEFCERVQEKPVEDEAGKVYDRRCGNGCPWHLAKHPHDEPVMSIERLRET